MWNVLTQKQAIGVNFVIITTTQQLLFLLCIYFELWVFVAVDCEWMGWESVKAEENT